MGGRGIEHSNYVGKRMDMSEFVAVHAVTTPSSTFPLPPPRTANHDGKSHACVCKHCFSRQTANNKKNPSICKTVMRELFGVLRIYIVYCFDCVVCTMWYFSAKNADGKEFFAWPKMRGIFCLNLDRILIYYLQVFRLKCLIYKQIRITRRYCVVSSAICWRVM